MLLGNYSVLNKNPGRAFAGSTVANTRASFGKSGPARGIYAGSPGVSKFNGIPSGYTPPYGWVIPARSGGMTAFNSIAGAGSASANLAGGLNGEAGLSGSGTISDATAALLIYAAAALEGSGSVSAEVLGNLALAAELAGSGDISGALRAAYNAFCDLTGSGDVSGSLAGSLSAASDLSGSGDVGADIVGAILAAADLEGSGALAAPLVGKGIVAAGLTGNASVDAAIVSIGNLMSVLQGEGTVEAAEARAVASMSAAILSYGVLSPENLAAAVWNAVADNFNTAGTTGAKLSGAASAGDPWVTSLPGAYPPGSAGALLGGVSSETWKTLIESGYTAEELLRLLVAALVGKASGGGTTNIAFRSLGDSKDRIAMTVDADGNRSAVSIDAT